MYFQKRSRACSIDSIAFSLPWKSRRRCDTVQLRLFQAFCRLCDLMDQAISGVSPASVCEATIMTVWPSNAAYAAGRVLGRLYAIRFPDIYIFRLGNLIALLSIPIALVLFFMRLAPYVGQRYTLTNRRIVVYRGLMIEEERSVPLDRFDAVDVVVQPGEEWYDAGDLVFRLGNTETFRLVGVSRPESFRSQCVKAQMAYVGVNKALARELAAV